MARTRFIAITALAVALVGLGQQTARSQVTGWHQIVAATPAKAKDATCVVYPLSDLGNDPNLAKWLADTIPGVIQPGSWGDNAGTRITYFAPAKVLVVYHHAAVHTKVKAFLADVKSAMRPEPGPIHLRKPPVMRAEFTEAAPAKTPQTAGAGYPVPAPQMPPKHLFHLIIRYEGDGLSDDTVAGLVKQVSNAAMVKTDDDAKPKSESAKGPSLGQLLHFIVRYEGDGIIDANVVALMKEMYGAPRNGGTVVPPAACVPSSVFGTSPMQPSTAYGAVRVAQRDLDERALEDTFGAARLRHITVVSAAGGAAQQQSVSKQHKAARNGPAAIADRPMRLRGWVAPYSKAESAAAGARKSCPGCRRFLTRFAPRSAMHPNDVLAALRRKPFVPFRLYVDDGSAYEIRHPELLLLTQSAAYVGIGARSSSTTRRGFLSRCGGRRIRSSRRPRQRQAASAPRAAAPRRRRVPPARGTAAVARRSALARRGTAAASAA